MTEFKYILAIFMQSKRLNTVENKSVVGGIQDNMFAGLGTIGKMV